MEKASNSFLELPTKKDGEQQQQQQQQKQQKICHQFNSQVLKSPHLLIFQIWFTTGYVRLTIWQLSS